MKPGEIRGPVKTEFGWHVIKLESASPEITRSFEDVRAELEPEFRHSQVEKAFGDAQEELDTTAFEAQGDIDAVASRLNLPVKRIERYTRAGSAELGATPKVTEAVFAPDVIAGRELRTVEIAPGKVVALGVKSHQPARPKPLEEVRAEVVESARLEAAGKLAAARAGEIVARAREGRRLAGATRHAGRARPRPRRRSRSAARIPALPAEVRDAAFRAPLPAGKPRYGVATLANGDTALWTVTAAEKGQLDRARPPTRARSPRRGPRSRRHVRRHGLHHVDARQLRHRRQPEALRIRHRSPRMRSRSGSLARAGTSGARSRDPPGHARGRTRPIRGSSCRRASSRRRRRASRR